MLINGGLEQKEARGRFMYGCF